MLTHVSRWMHGKWERITAEEADELFPYTVPANQKVFICELCGHYVTFTGPGAGLGKRTRHFRHSRGDEDKNCEERSIGYDNAPLQEKDRGLPIIIHVDGDRCTFSLGFPALPDDILSDMQAESVIIKYGSESRKYNISRFNYGRRTYFSVGTQLEKRYIITFSSDILRSSCGFPEITEGFVGSGRLFDVRSGRLVQFDGDVSVGRKYFYYTRIRMSEMKTPYVKRLMTLDHGYLLYEVMPTALDRRNAEFFLSLRARLTNTPLSMQTIWPPSKQTDGTIIHRRKYVRAFLYGDAKVSLNDMLLKPIADGKGLWSLYRISTGENTANVLIGRSRIIQDNQYLRSDYTTQQEAPRVEIRNINNEVVDVDSNSVPPPRNRLRLKFEYDGQVYIYREKQSVGFLRIPADQEVEITDIKRGTKIQCFIGGELEREYTVSLSVEQIKTLDMDYLYQRLLKSKGDKVSVSHSVAGTLAGKYKDQRICTWIRRQRNVMPKDALAILISKKR